MRRLLRFNLKSLLVVVTIVTISVGLYMSRVREQQQSVRLIRQYHGKVIFPGVPGDANGDEVTDREDFDIISANFGKSPATRADGDANFNTEVDLSDFRVWKANEGATAESQLTNQAAIPEPTGLALISVALACAAWRLAVLSDASFSPHLS